MLAAFRSAIVLDFVRFAGHFPQFQLKHSQHCGPGSRLKNRIAITRYRSECESYILINISQIHSLSLQDRMAVGYGSSHRVIGDHWHRVGVQGQQRNDEEYSQKAHLSHKKVSTMVECLRKTFLY